jgi:hypothetical protein
MIDYYISENLQLQQKTQVLIQSNSQFIKELEVNPEIVEQERRNINNLNGSLIKHFQEVIMDYQQVQNELKSFKQGMIIRNAEIILNRKLDQFEKEDIVHDPKRIQELLNNRLLDKASNKIVNAVTDLEDRHNDIVKLERVCEIYNILECESSASNVY